DRSEAPPRRPTISDVARRAGVSTGTVSRYLNGGRCVSAESSKAVTRAIRETGYVANSTARRLRTGRSGTVAFLVDEPPARFFEDPNFESLVIEVGQALAARDQTMVLLLAGDAESAERAETFLRTSGADGAVTASAQPGHHLFQLRPEAFSEAIGCAAAEGPDPRVVAVQHGDYSVASGAEAMRAILRAHPGVDALFAANDRMARGAIEVLQAEGLSVPGDVLVGGF